MRHIKIHGNDVTTKILGYYNTLEKLQEAAIKFSKDNDIVDSKEWANMRLEDGLTGGNTSNNFTELSKKKISNRHAGTNNPQSKLNIDQVLEIYHSCESPEALSKIYCIGTGQIFGIKRKIYYKDVTKDILVMPGQYKGKNKVRIIIPCDIVRLIYSTEETYSYFKENFGVSPVVVKNIKSKISYKDITKDLGTAKSVKKYNLTNKDTIDIFYSDLTLKELSKLYNVSIETVRNIKNATSRKFFKDEF